jgi:hypothetical protein
MRHLEHVEAAKDEALKLGASFTIEHGKKHLIGVIAFNGQVRKQALSRSLKKDQNVCHIVRKFVRRAVEEMTK